MFINLWQISFYFNKKVRKEDIIASLDVESRFSITLLITLMCIFYKADGLVMTAIRRLFWYMQEYAFELCIKTGKLMVK